MSLRNQKFYLFSLLFNLLCVSIVDAANVPQFLIMTEEWEPYNFRKDGVVRGISADMLVLMLEKVGSTQGRSDIKIFPWIRAYKYIQKKPGTILFTTTRTKEREKRFKWVGPIIEIEFSIHALKSRNIKINSPEDLKKYKIGTLRGDVTEDLLIKKAGMKRSEFSQVSANISNTKKLLSNRVDLIAQNKDTLRAICKQIGTNPDKFEAVFTLDKKAMYYAFHKDTPDSVIKMFQTAFDEIKKKGKLDEILRQYGK